MRETNELFVVLQSMTKNELIMVVMIAVSWGLPLEEVVKLIYDKVKSLGRI